MVAGDCIRCAPATPEPCVMLLNEQMPHSMRDETRWGIWEAFLLALESKRPNGLFDLCVFQPGTENKQREETLLHFNPDSPINLRGFTVRSRRSSARCCHPAEVFPGSLRFGEGFLPAWRNTGQTDWSLE